jgi:hypothetical protein
MTLEAMIKVTTQEEADQCLEEYISELVAAGQKRRRAKKIAKNNLGYYAGYYDEETARRVWKLYRTKHPVFNHRWPDATEAFHLGMKWAKSHP